MKNFDEFIEDVCDDALKPGIHCASGSTPETPPDDDDGTGTGIDPRCSDPAFANAHPEECKLYQRLIIKPNSATLCQLASQQFKAFLAQGDAETELTSGVVFTSSSQGIALVGGSSGKVTGVGAGIATVTASWQDQFASAQVTVMESCCNDEVVGMLVLIDNSQSMSQLFGPTWGNKLSFAKAAARRWADELNISKDFAGAMSFADASTLVQGLTQDTTLLKAQINSISGSSGKTSILAAIQGAIDYLDTQLNITRKVIAIISDGEPMPGDDLAQLYQLAAQFQSAGNVIVAMGVRAHDDGFDLLNHIASGGFFISAHDAVAAASLELFSGVKGYFCAGNCTPAGDVVINKAALNFSTFNNWDVLNGYVDLIGGTPPYELYDLLPGNGLYVDLAGSSSPWNGKLILRYGIGVVVGNSHEVRFQLAGNQRENFGNEQVLVEVLDQSDNVIASSTTTITSYLQDFTTYALAFTPGGGVTDVRVRIQMIAHSGTQSFGTLLDNVSIHDLTTSTLLFEDGFESDNAVYIPPRCGAATLPEGAGVYGYDYCYGSGCLTEPVPEQVADPDPQESIET